METKHEALNALLETLGIYYSATFVPFSRSRNAKENPNIEDLSLNWKVKLEHAAYAGGAACVIGTDYMQGIGHIPGYKHRLSLTVDEYDSLLATCEFGRTRHRYLASKPLPPPLLRDVMHCLVSDAEAIDYTFEDWAANCGYDTDSRKAESVYSRCLDIGLRLRRMLGDEKLIALREAYQDY